MSDKFSFEPRSNYSAAENRAFAREELVYNVTEDLLVILEDMGITKSELARKLGKSKSYVTQVLSGSRNMTLGSFSDICFALGFKPEINLPVCEVHKVQDEVVKSSAFEDLEVVFSSLNQEHNGLNKPKKIDDNVIRPQVSLWTDHCQVA